MSRPRTISSNDILRIAYDLVMEYGPKGLTFSRLGDKVGLVPAAIAKRFVSKQQLLSAIDNYAAEQSDEAVRIVLEQHDAPIDAIIALLVSELAFASSLQRFIHGQQFLLADLSDPKLYANYQASVEQRHARVTELLRHAQEKRQITSDADCVELARLLQIIQQGAGHLWAMTQEVPIDTYIDTYIRMALRPYLLSNSS